MLNRDVWLLIGHVYPGELSAIHAVNAWVSFESNAQCQEPTWLQPPKESGFMGSFTVPTMPHEYAAYRDVHRLTFYQRKT